MIGFTEVDTVLALGTVPVGIQQFGAASPAVGAVGRPTARWADPDLS